MANLAVPALCAARDAALSLEGERRTDMLLAKLGGQVPQPGHLCAVMVL
jgi:hypothetical protein